jgi:hypothetical protein
MGLDVCLGVPSIFKADGRIVAVTCPRRSPAYAHRLTPTRDSNTKAEGAGSIDGSFLCRTKINASLGFSSTEFKGLSPRTV